jgi:DNA replication and repair protein RecF
VLLRSLSQINFRNLRTPRLEFGPGVTAVVGHNASGKSNLLDAIYLGCSGELPSGKVAEALRLGEEEGFVGVKLERQDGLIGVEVGLAPGRKLIRLDGQLIRSYELARVAAAVLVTPEDSELVHGPPSAPRISRKLLSRTSGKAVER